MFHKMLVRFLLIAWFVGVQTYQMQAADLKYTIFVYEGLEDTANLWKVDASGKIKLFENLPTGNVEGTRTTTTPILARSGDKVAYWDEGNIWIKDLRKGRAWQATREGFLGDKGYFPVDVAMNGWSWDGRRLLYTVRTVIGGTDMPNRKIKHVTTGYSICDLETGTSRPLAINGTYSGWTKDNLVLYQEPYVDSPCLSAVDLEGNTRNVWADWNYEQFIPAKLDPSGNRLLGLVQKNEERQIVEINLSDGSLIKRFPPRKGVRLDDLSYSPGGRKVAWVLEKDTWKGNAVTSELALYVDGHELRKMKDQYILRYEWIDDKSAVIVDGLDLMVLNMNDGSVLGEKTKYYTNAQATRTVEAINANSVYIPKDLSECFDELEKRLDQTLIDEMKAVTESEMSKYHFGVGMWMRNNWGLWGESRLAKYFNSLGVYQPDEMSGIILTSFWRHLNNQPIKLEEQIGHHPKKKNMGVFDKIRKMLGV